MENTVNKETEDEIERRREFHRVINKITNLPEQNEAGTSTSNTRQTQPQEDSFGMNTPKTQSHPIPTMQSQYRGLIPNATWEQPASDTSTWDKPLKSKTIQRGILKKRYAI